MYLNFDGDKQELRYEINGENLGIAYDDIERGDNIIYRLEIQLSRAEMSVEILDFAML